MDIKSFLFLLSLLAVSCTVDDEGRRPVRGDEDGQARPGLGTDLGKPAKTVTYVTAMEYPEGYDWRADVEKGTVRCSLVVYADGERMMALPVGDEYEVSSDPDMHRMSKGHLYTDYSTDDETVIKMDGEEIIRYSGREMICDLIEIDGYVHTLGHNRSGEGFAYRVNGEAVIERERGHTFGCLYEEDGRVGFAFREPIEAVGETIERYYYALGGEVEQTAVREDVKKVWDIVSHEGHICYLASIVGVSSPVLFCSGEMKALKMPIGSEMLTCRIIVEGDALYVEGLCQREGNPLTSGLWQDNGQVYFFSDGMMVSSICMGENGVCCVLNAVSPLAKGSIYRFGSTSFMPDGYASVGSSPAVVADGVLHVGLSSLTGAPPLIWKDGDTSPLDLNGFISTVSTDKD